MDSSKSQRSALHIPEGTLAGTGGGGVMQPPCGFSGISFLLTVRLSHFFYSFPPIFFTSPPENFKTLTPLKFDL